MRERTLGKDVPLRCGKGRYREAPLSREWHNEQAADVGLSVVDKYAGLREWVVILQVRGGASDLKRAVVSVRNSHCILEGGNDAAGEPVYGVATDI